MKKQYVKKIPFLALAGFICAVSIGTPQVSLAKQATSAPKGVAQQSQKTLPKIEIGMDTQQRKLWNENHKKLTSIIQKPIEHENTIELFFKQHALLYSSKIDDSQINTLEDELLKNITEETFRKYPTVSQGTKNPIVWHLWHIARIEDITMNILVEYYRCMTDQHVK